MGIFSIIERWTEGYPKHRIAGQEKQVAIRLSINICIADRIVILRHGSQRRVIPQLGGRIVPKAFISILNAFVPFLVVEIESAGESIGGLLIEVVFRNGVVLVIDKRQPLNDVGFHSRIVFGNSAPLILRPKLRFRRSGIWHP